MFFNCNHNFKIILIFFILIGCQLQDPNNNHGIVFVENRSNELVINKSNKNDVLKLIGQPHSKSINNDNEWFYIERILTKGEFHKLGQNILKENNVLVLDFDKYGILKYKKMLDKNDIRKMTFSEKNTENELAQKSFIEKFLSSIRTRMYKRD